MKNPDEINQKQKEFYDSKKKNFATRLWSYFRNGILNNTRKKLGVEKEILDLHTSWFGDLSNKKVLDLGCYEGNSLSFYLAKNSKEYLAIDLSEKGIETLSSRLKDIPSAKAITMDFMSTDFRESDFDLIYAYGVLHHFQDAQNLINKLNEKLSSNGEIISYDPLETSLPIKFVRRIYRPFQSDRAWEWPFSKKVYYLFDNAFKIKERRAILGKAKWFFIINLLPISVKKKQVIVRKWHKEDWGKSQVSDPYMFDCMQLTMLMQKKN